MKKTRFIFALIVIPFSSFSQVGIGTTSADGSAILDLESTTKSLLLPSMTIEQIGLISLPQEDLIVYSLNCLEKGMFIHSGTNFVSLSTGKTNAEAIAE